MDSWDSDGVKTGHILIGAEMLRTGEMGQKY